MSRLLLEIGTEAIPAGFLLPVLALLRERAEAGLRELRLEATGVRTLGTPYRVVLEVEGLAGRQEDLTREVLGPRVDIAFKDGVPSPAAVGFARKNGIDPEALERVTTDRGEFVRATVHVPGTDATEVLPGFLEKLVEGLPWPKTMVWNETRFLFPRPMRWLVALLDDAVLPLTVGGLESGRRTRGHRLHGPGMHPVPDAGALAAVLDEAGVVLDPEVRAATIHEGLQREAARLGGVAVPDEGLVREVTYLAEHPTVYSGSFDRAFLDLPREIVVTAMRSHQRYFALEDRDGNLLPHFLVVTDGAWEDPTLVIEGNQRVLRARLADARFYWDVDLKAGLDARAEGLRNVVWLESVGTVHDKSERVLGLVEALGHRWHTDGWADIREDALRAARLAKADLATEMIKDGKEFTGLQGIVGARYAEALGESPVVCAALAEQYLPRGPEDPLPASQAGTLLAFADRLDTIVGCWGAGFVPSGSQDPYALRRAANGLVRMLLEKELHLSLREMVQDAAQRLPQAVRGESLVNDVLGFLRDRTAWFLKEKGIPYDVVDAVLAADADDALDALARARALEAVRGEPALEKLVVGFKRAANILKGVDPASLPDPAAIDWGVAEPSEQELHRAAATAAAGVAEARSSRDYPGMLRGLLELRAPIDRFFEEVMVMAEDPAERNRRLALLAEVRGLFDHLCDLSRIVIEGE